MSLVVSLNLNQHGWALMGPAGANKSNVMRYHLVTIHCSLGQYAFWSLWESADFNAQQTGSKIFQKNSQHDEACILNSLQRFWKLKELSTKNHLTEEEKIVKNFTTELTLASKEAGTQCAFPSSWNQFRICVSTNQFRICVSTSKPLPRCSLPIKKKLLQIQHSGKSTIYLFHHTRY